MAVVNLAVLERRMSVLQQKIEAERARIEQQEARQAAPCGPCRWCGHTWVSRGPELKRCPHCSRYGWKEGGPVLLLRNVKQELKPKIREAAAEGEAPESIAQRYNLELVAVQGVLAADVPQVRRNIRQHLKPDILAAADKGVSPEMIAALMSIEVGAVRRVIANRETMDVESNRRKRVWEHKEDARHESALAGIQARGGVYEYQWCMDECLQHQWLLDNPRGTWPGRKRYRSGQEPAGYKEQYERATAEMKERGIVPLAERPGRKEKG